MSRKNSSRDVIGHWYSSPDQQPISIIVCDICEREQEKCDFTGIEMHNKRDTHICDKCLFEIENKIYEKECQ